MKLVLSSLLFLVIAVTSEAAPRRTASVATGVKVAISAKFADGTSVKANVAGTTSLTGSGTVSAGTASYPLRITTGSIKQSRYVNLGGTITVAGQSTTFQLEGDRVSGTVRLTYKGAKGTTITLAGVGNVSMTTG